MSHGGSGGAGASSPTRHAAIGSSWHLCPFCGELHGNLKAQRQHVALCKGCCCARCGKPFLHTAYFRSGSSLQARDSHERTCQHDGHVHTRTSPLRWHVYVCERRSEHHGVDFSPAVADVAGARTKELNAADGRGRSVMHLVCDEVRRLLQLRSHVARLGMWLDFLEALVEHGADAFLLDAQGRTPLQLLFDSGAHAELASSDVWIREPIVQQRFVALWQRFVVRCCEDGDARRRALHSSTLLRLALTLPWGAEASDDQVSCIGRLARCADGAAGGGAAAAAAAAAASATSTGAPSLLQAFHATDERGRTALHVACDVLSKWGLASSSFSYSNDQFREQSAHRWVDVVHSLVNGGADMFTPDASGVLPFPVLFDGGAQMESGNTAQLFGVARAPCWSGQTAQRIAELLQRIVRRYCDEQAVHDCCTRLLLPDSLLRFAIMLPFDTSAVAESCIALLLRRDGAASAAARHGGLEPPLLLALRRSSGRACQLLDTLQQHDASALMRVIGDALELELPLHNEPSCVLYRILQLGGSPLMCAFASQGAAAFDRCRGDATLQLLLQRCLFAGVDLSPHYAPLFFSTLKCGFVGALQLLMDLPLLDEFDMQSDEAGELLAFTHTHASQARKARFLPRVGHDGFHYSYEQRATDLPAYAAAMRVLLSHPALAPRLRLTTKQLCQHVASIPREWYRDDHSWHVSLVRALLSVCSKHVDFAAAFSRADLGVYMRAPDDRQLTVLDCAQDDEVLLMLLNDERSTSAMHAVVQREMAHAEAATAAGRWYFTSSGLLPSVHCPEGMWLELLKALRPPSDRDHDDRHAARSYELARHRYWGALERIESIAALFVERGSWYPLWCQRSAFRVARPVGNPSVASSSTGAGALRQPADESLCHRAQQRLLQLWVERMWALLQEHTPLPDVLVQCTLEYLCGEDVRASSPDERRS